MILWTCPVQSWNFKLLSSYKVLTGCLGNGTSLWDLRVIYGPEVVSERLHREIIIFCSSTKCAGTLRTLAMLPIYWPRQCSITSSCTGHYCGIWAHLHWGSVGFDDFHSLFTQKLLYFWFFFPLSVFYIRNCTTQQDKNRGSFYLFFQSFQSTQALINPPPLVCVRLLFSVVGYPGTAYS